MANILLDNDFTIRTTKLTSDKEYDFSDLLFYIPNIFNDSSVYISLVDGNGITEIIPLQFSNNYNSYKIYKINYGNKIRISSGKISLKIILIDSQNNCVQSVNSINLSIIVDSYNLIHQLSITKELESYIQIMYDKIIDITKLNIKISEDLLKRGEDI